MDGPNVSEELSVADVLACDFLLMAGNSLQLVME